MPSDLRTIGEELRRILNLFLQQLHPAQSWETDFFSGFGSAIDHEANMIGECSGFLNVPGEENATSHVGDKYLLNQPWLEGGFSISFCFIFLLRQLSRLMEGKSRAT